MLARCRASSVRTGLGNGSSARSSTGGASSIRATRLMRACASSPCEGPSRLAWMRFQISYSSKRLAIKFSCQSTSGARDPPQGVAPMRQNYRDRSPIVPVASHLSHAVPEGCDRLARDGTSSLYHRRRDPAAAHCVGEHGVRKQRAASRARRNQFRDYAVTIGDEHGFASRCEPNVLAEPTFQKLQANRSHGLQVATRGHLVKPLAMRDDAGLDRLLRRRRGWRRRKRGRTPIRDPARAQHGRRGLSHLGWPAGAELSGGGRRDRAMRERDT